MKRDIKLNSSGDSICTRWTRISREKAAPVISVAKSDDNIAQNALVT